MKLKTLKFYKDIFITSLASLVSTHAANAGEVKVNPLPLDGQEASDLLMGRGEPSSFNSRPKLTKPFILKRFDQLHAVNLSHRSHRSHSSHRSHYSGSSSSGSSSSRSSSSYSSGASGGSSGYSTGSSSRSTQSSASGLYQSQPTPVTPSQQPEFLLAEPKVFKLGDRIIRLGMKGMDVTEVINILIKKEYLLLATGRKIFTGELEYTTVVANAIKRFQSDFAIEATGVVDAQTVMLLKIE